MAQVQCVFCGASLHGVRDRLVVRAERCSQRGVIGYAPRGSWLFCGWQCAAAWFAPCLRR